MGQALNIEKYVQAYVDHKVSSSDLHHLDSRTWEMIHRNAATDVLNAVYSIIETDMRTEVEAEARNDLAWGIVDELQDIEAPKYVVDHISQKYYDKKADLARFDRTTPGFRASHVENPVTGEVTEADRG